MKRTEEEKELIAYCKKYRKNQRVVIRGLGECKVCAWHPQYDRAASRIEVIDHKKHFYDLSERDVVSC